MTVNKISHKHSNITLRLEFWKCNLPSPTFWWGHYFSFSIQPFLFLSQFSTPLFSSGRFSVLTIWKTSSKNACLVFINFTQLPHPLRRTRQSDDFLFLSYNIWMYSQFKTDLKMFFFLVIQIFSIKYWYYFMAWSLLHRLSVLWKGNTLLWKSSSHTVSWFCSVFSMWNNKSDIDTRSSTFSWRLA